MSTTLKLTDVANGSKLEVVAERLVIAGFTGRDSASVTAHVDELRDLGVPVPESTPSFYVLPAELLTTDDEIHVAGGFTSGEVEPVIIMHEKGWLLGVGSDHTDRDLEADDIARSKGVCPKPISSSVLPLEAVADWDAVGIASHADGEQYQRGELADLLPLDAILAAAKRAQVELGAGTVLYLGTLPVRGGLRPASRFEASLEAGAHRLALSYTITTGLDEPGDRAHEQA